METLVAVLTLTALIALLAAPVMLVERRAKRRGAEILRQIALTDALHARLGAAVAPVVRRRSSGWQVAVAVPFERPAVVTTVLTTVDEVFGSVAYEVVLSRQRVSAPMTRTQHTPTLGQESLSWT